MESKVDETAKKAPHVYSEECKNAKLLVPTELKGIHEKSGEEFELEFADRVDYDENGSNPVIWYKTKTAK